jgi:hypothetical protein
LITFEYDQQKWITKIVQKKPFRYLRQIYHEGGDYTAIVEQDVNSSPYNESTWSRIEIDFDAKGYLKEANSDSGKMWVKPKSRKIVASSKEFELDVSDAFEVRSELLSTLDINNLISRDFLKLIEY